MAEKLHDMKNTQSSFQVRGIVTGVLKQRFYKSGTGKNGNSWNSINFGVKIAENKTVYISMSGFPRSEVFYYKKGENGAKGTTERVAWKNRKKSPGEGYRLIGVNISTGKDDNGKNINDTFTEYDAIEWLHENLKDGDSVFIKGSLQFSSFTDRNGNTKRKVELVPNQISYTQQPVDFYADDYKEMCEFENTLVFKSIDKEEDANGKATGRFELCGYSISFNSVENVSFVIGADSAKLANNMKKAMKPGYAIKTFGRVDVINDIVAVDEDDDDWGEKSPMERVNSESRFEYVVYRADPSSIEKEDYSEKDIAEAIRKINAAKTAKENFGDKSGVSVDADDNWDSDDDSDESPWD